MPAEITRSPDAERDLELQIDYFDEHSSELARRFLAAVRETFDFLVANRDAGQRCHFSHPEAEGIRIWAVHGFRNHLVFYRRMGDGIEIVRVLHGARDIAALFNEGTGGDK